MRPSITSRNSDDGFSSPPMRLQRRSIASLPICFEPFSLDDIDRLTCLPGWGQWRSCDFTLGGIYMWIDYFHYRRAFVDNTLFIQGVSEADSASPAFSMPVGAMAIDQAVALLRRHCCAAGIPLRLSAVPEPVIPALRALGAKSVEELPAWGDYIYDAHALASLSGKKYNKKRNHVNRFVQDNPGYQLCPITQAMLPELISFVEQKIDAPASGSSPMAEYEHRQAIALLSRITRFPFVGAALTTPSHGIVAFTVGECVADTLHLHIEKMNHRVAGAGEAINNLFARHIVETQPKIAFINRQDDAGDPGLCQAKLSYHPAYVLRKYEVIF